MRDEKKVEIGSVYVDPKMIEAAQKCLDRCNNQPHVFILIDDVEPPLIPKHQPTREDIAVQKELIDHFLKLTENLPPIPIEPLQLEFFTNNPAQIDSAIMARFPRLQTPTNSATLAKANSADFIDQETLLRMVRMQNRLSPTDED